MSIGMSATYEKAKAIDEKLLASDFQYTCISVEHNDGSRFFFTHSIAQKDEYWWMIFTEHHGFHIYHEEDCVVRVFEHKL